MPFGAGGERHLERLSRLYTVHIGAARAGAISVFVLLGSMSRRTVMPTWARKCVDQ